MELKGVDMMDKQEVGEVLVKFSEKYKKEMMFNMKLDDRKEVWRDIFKLMSNKVELLSSLVCVRILSRDKTGLNEAVSSEMIELLMELSGMEDKVQKNDEVALEAAKVLSNLIHQSSVVQSYCTTNGFLFKIFNKIKKYPEQKVNKAEMKMFDFRLLFLFTALCPEQRDVAKDNHNGVKILTDSIENTLDEKIRMISPVLDDDDCSVICETLKVLFNLTVETKQEDIQELVEVARMINKLLRINKSSEELEIKVVSNCINVVTNMNGQVEAFMELVRSTDAKFQAKPDIMSHDLVMNSIQTFVDFLYLKSGCIPSLKEDITPVISVLYNISLSISIVRKYLKEIVLPPLKVSDLNIKPEEGNSLRSRLVSLLTNTSGDISTMVEEFLFVLCKYNVNRLIKHTGYGNAAGLLARRGLMGGGRANDQADELSEDEDSDTEEYVKERHKVNPVTRVVEEPRPNPLEGMSDEQKEYEAVQLANLIDKMSRSGLIQPAKVGEDGRPQPVDHVLQLLDED